MVRKLILWLHDLKRELIKGKKMTQIKKIIVMLALLNLSAFSFAEIKYEEANYQLSEREYLKQVVGYMNASIEAYKKASSEAEKKAAASFIVNAFIDNNAEALMIQQVLSESRYKVNKKNLKIMLSLMSKDIESYPYQSILEKSIAKAHLKTAIANL